MLSYLCISNGTPWRALCREASISRQTNNSIVRPKREIERQREMEGQALSYPRCIYTERSLISILQLPGVNARDVGNCVLFPPTDGKCDRLKGITDA